MFELRLLHLIENWLLIVVIIEEDVRIGRWGLLLYLAVNIFHNLWLQAGQVVVILEIRQVALLAQFPGQMVVVCNEDHVVCINDAERD